MNPAPTDNILVYVLWALTGLLGVSIGALVWVIKRRPGGPHQDISKVMRAELMESRHATHAHIRALAEAMRNPAIRGKLSQDVIDSIDDERRKR
jgi:hypothetical protein